MVKDLSKEVPLELAKEGQRVLSYPYLLRTLKQLNSPDVDLL